MAVKCSNGKMIGHLFVRAESSDGARPVCKLGTLVNIQHRVEVKNLYGYDAYVDCEGTIPNQPGRVLKFQSSNKSDTATHWTVLNVRVPVWLSHPFVHVLLLPLTPGGTGTELVSATIKVTWPQPEEGDRDTVDIQVDV